MFSLLKKRTNLIILVILIVVVSIFLFLSLMNYLKSKEVVDNFKKVYCEHIIQEVQLGESFVGERDFPEIRYIQSELGLISDSSNVQNENFNFLKDLYSQKMKLAGEFKNTSDEFWNNHKGKCIFCPDPLSPNRLDQSEMDEFNALTDPYVKTQYQLNKRILEISGDILSSKEGVCKDFKIDDQSIINNFKNN